MVKQCHTGYEKWSEQDQGGFDVQDIVKRVDELRS